MLTVSEIRWFATASSPQIFQQRKWMPSQLFPVSIQIVKNSFSIAVTVEMKINVTLALIY